MCSYIHVHIQYASHSLYLKIYHFSHVWFLLKEDAFKIIFKKSDVLFYPFSYVMPKAQTHTHKTKYIFICVNIYSLVNIKKDCTLFDRDTPESFTKCSSHRCERPRCSYAVQKAWGWWRGTSCLSPAGGATVLCKTADLGCVSSETSQSPSAMQVSLWLSLSGEKPPPPMSGAERRHQNQLSG